MCTDFSFLGFLVVCSKKSRAQEMKWEANPLSSFEATRFKFRRRMHGEEILIFSFFLLFFCSCIIRKKRVSPPMIHEKLKATNSNEFIIENMVEIFNKSFYSAEANEKCDKQRKEMKTFLNP